MAVMAETQNAGDPGVRADSGSGVSAHSTGTILATDRMCCAPEKIIPIGRSWAPIITSRIGKEDFGKLLAARKGRFELCDAKAGDSWRMDLRNAE